MAGIKDITLGQYVSRDSFIHRLDPRTKILTCFFIMIILLLVHRIEFILVFFGFAVFSFKFAGLSPTLVIGNLRPFILLFLLTFMLHGLFTEGTTIISIPVIDAAVTSEGLIMGVLYTFRISCMIIFASLLTLTTAPMSLTDALEQFLNPFRRIGLPAHEIAMMLSISLRFIPILLNEIDRIKKAQISRGICFEGNIINRIKSVVPLLIPLFLSSFRRANELAVAMDSRCYRGGEGRTSLFILKFNKRDILTMTVVCVISLPALIIR